LIISTIDAGIEGPYMGLTIGDVMLGQIAKIYASLTKIGGRNSMPAIIAYQAFV
jgi:hypothetical protein